MQSVSRKQPSFSRSLTRPGGTGFTRQTDGHVSSSSLKACKLQTASVECPRKVRESRIREQAWRAVAVVAEHAETVLWAAELPDALCQARSRRGPVNSAVAMNVVDGKKERVVFPALRALAAERHEDFQPKPPFPRRVYYSELLSYRMPGNSRAWATEGLSIVVGTGIFIELFGGNFPKRASRTILQDVKATRNIWKPLATIDKSAVFALDRVRARLAIR